MLDYQPQRWKPRAKAVKTVQQLPLDRQLVVQVKCDGEFSVVSYQRGVRTFSINIWGTTYGESSPWLREVKNALDKQTGIQEAVILAETYGIDYGKMMKLPALIHNLKTGYNSKIRLGIFDLASVNGKTANQNYLWRLQELETWFKDCKQVNVLPYIHPITLGEIHLFWKKWVEDLDYEGLFARDDRQDLYKIKPYLDLDCVIIGLNKRELWDKGEVTSIKLALMENEGTLVEVGDVASGIDHQLRKELYHLLTFKKKDFQDWVQIAPFIVVQVQAMETFNCQKNRYKNSDGYLENIGIREAVSLRHPRLIRFREDKHATLEDIGYDRQLLGEP